MNYISDRIFRIWGYAVSHSFLLLRSPQLFEDVKDYSNTTNYNVDIEFWGVGYLELPDMLKGITVKEIVEGIPAKFYKYSKSLGYKVFEIKSEGSLFFVVAAGCRVGRNNWDGESRIMSPNLEYDEIMATS